MHYLVIFMNTVGPYMLMKPEGEVMKDARLC